MDYSSMESSQEYSVLESIMVDIIVGVIMIGCVFMDKPTK
jgi:hypothetical protein